MPKRKNTKLHAIQLESVKVIELFIKSNQRPETSIEVDSANFSMSSSASPYDNERKEIRVITSIEIGMEEKPETPFSMRIRLIGNFRVDDTNFDTKLLPHWARNNAPMILYPFLREHAFALSSRCGFSPVLLPLLVVPTLTPKAKKSIDQHPVADS